MYETLLYIALILGIVPVIYLYIKGKKISQTAKSFLPFLYLTAFASIYELVGSLLLELDVAIWFKVYALLEFAALYYFFHKTLPKKIHWLLLAFCAIFLTEYCIFLIIGKDDDQLQSTGILNCTTVIFIIFSVLYYFAKRLQVQQKDRGAPDWPLFCFMGAILLYYCATLFLFLMANSIFKSTPAEFSNYWILNILTTILFRSLIILGVWKI